MSPSAKLVRGPLLLPTDRPTKHRVREAGRGTCGYCRINAIQKYAIELPIASYNLHKINAIPSIPTADIFHVTFLSIVCLASITAHFTEAKERDQKAIRVPPINSTTAVYIHHRHQHSITSIVSAKSVGAKAGLYSRPRQRNHEDARKGRECAYHRLICMVGADWRGWTHCSWQGCSGRPS